MEKKKIRKQVHVDSTLHARLKARAAKSGQHLGDFVDQVIAAGLREIRRRSA